MSDSALAQAVHLDLMRFNAVTTEMEGGEVERRDGELLYAAAIDFPFFSGAMREREGPGWEETIESARAWFGPRRRGYIAFLRPGDGEPPAGAGLAELMRYPEMVVSERLEPPPLPAGAELRRVSDRAGAGDYWAVCAASYPSLGFPDGVFEAMSDRLLLDRRVAATLAYLEGEPVAAAMVMVAERLGLVAWVGTVERARHSGLGAAVTVAVTNEAFERGAEAAHLQASPMGEPVYLRLGYRELFSYRLFGAAPPAAG